MIKSISKASRRILETLIRDLDEDHQRSRKIDTASPSFVPVSVECIGPNTFSVCHYVEQNGDLCADPEVVFFRDSSGDFFPIEFKQDLLGVYQQFATVHEGQITKYSPRAQRDCASFCHLWMHNIKAQQPRWFSGEAA